MPFQTAVASSAVSTIPFDVDGEVKRRYAEGAGEREAALCCPTNSYEAKYLELLPPEIIDKDYGCGDPSRHISAGETVVDLGSGGGKICYILAQRVGAAGRVIGIDFNDAMLALSRKYLDDMAAKLGYHNIEFRKGRIQDLALDLEAAGSWLERNPIANVEQAAAFERYCAEFRRQTPLIADGSVDAVVSNCVLNLVAPEQKTKLFGEIYRVLSRGGRAVISDIVSDKDPTPAMLADPQLWSGCITGALRETQFIEAFEHAGFHGIEILARAEQPWKIIDGVEFRALTLRAYKGKHGPCVDRRQAVIYKGPWKQVHDDDGHVFVRGQKLGVCEKTYELLTAPDGPYAAEMIPVLPAENIASAPPEPFDGSKNADRSPLETKGTGSCDQTTSCC